MCRCETCASLASLLVINMLIDWFVMSLSAHAHRAVLKFVINVIYRNMLICLHGFHVFMTTESDFSSTWLGMEFAGTRDILTVKCQSKRALTAK